MIVTLYKYDIYYKFQEKKVKSRILEILERLFVFSIEMTPYRENSFRKQA